VTVEPVDLERLRRYRRAANYLAAAQIFLQDNVLLHEPLRAEHLKRRPLGHWGTCPGITFVYAHLDRLIRETRQSCLLVTGPGHGAPANLANLWLEGSLGEVDDQYRRDGDGLDRLVKGFSWPGGFPSHLAPLVPGVIHEGGELGYALGKSFGAALDDPDLLVACLVGDGEAETGPTAGAWHGNKFLDPVGDGAVLPILHLNGWKIASPTIYATMTDAELTALFRGFGWSPRFVDVTGADDPDTAMATTVSGAHAEIRELQEKARGGARPDRPTWPMLVLRSPKGWTGIAELDGEPIEGTWRSHQVPAPDAATDDGQRAALEGWLRSYRPEELFTHDGAPEPDLLDLPPRGDLRMGMTPRANGGRVRTPLELPDWTHHAVDVDAAAPGTSDAGATGVLGGWLREVVRANPRTFRIVCPDELASNKLDGVLEATDRVYQWPVPAVAEHVGPTGRVMEVLSEHNCQAWLEGYVLTGRHGVFSSYEAFVQIVDSMVNQYAKFLKMAAEVPWRAPVSSLTYLLTSDGWRQEHNGYSHQGPGFINHLLQKKADAVRIYLPPDANTLLQTFHHCLDVTAEINLVVVTKNALPQYLGAADAEAHARAGASAWRWAGTCDEADTADVVLACAGTVPTLETLAAAQLLARDAPDLRTRVVNVTDLLSLEHPRTPEDPGGHPHGMSEERFAALFGTDTPVLFDFHGYPHVVHQLVHERPGPSRFHARGYVEEGTTTTPFDLLVANNVSRFQLALDAARLAERDRVDLDGLRTRYTTALEEHRRYILAHGEDPPWADGWRDTPA
jgi:xylulose-5-phosphate/fructose-6-phosphate phosphoketolase